MSIQNKVHLRDKFAAANAATSYLDYTENEGSGSLGIIFSNVPEQQTTRSLPKQWCHHVFGTSITQKIVLLPDETHRVQFGFYVAKQQNRVCDMFTNKVRLGYIANRRLRTHIPTYDLIINDFLGLGDLSPFEQLENLHDDRRKVADLITHIRKTFHANYSERLAKRIEYLIEAAREDEPEEVGVSLESLRGFIAFLQSEITLKYPDILVLSPGGNVIAQWGTASNRKFSAQFLSSSEVRFVVFRPNKHQPDQPYIVSGIISIDDLPKTIKDNDVTWTSL